MSAINTAARNEVERGSTITGDLAVCYEMPKADGAIPVQRLVQVTSGGEVQVGTFNSTTVIGVYPGRVNYPGHATMPDNGQPVPVQVGRTFVTADGAITAGQEIKCGSAGRAIQLVTSTLAGTTIEDNVGVAFTNQPANDGLELVSSSASDITQTFTAYFTRTGQGNTLFSETVTINGTTQVTFAVTDAALVLAIEKSAATVGTITLREASANATIATLAAGTLSAGKIAVTAGQTKAYNQAPTAVADAATTKTVGILGTDENDAALGVGTSATVALTGAVPVTFGDTFKTVTFLLVGDLEVARTVTVKVGAQDSPGLSCGRALSSATAQNGRIQIYFQAPHGALTSSPVSGVAANFKTNRGESVLDGSNPTSVTHGLTTCISVSVTLKGSAAPGVGTSLLTAVINGAAIDVYAWKVTGTGDTTLIASTGTEGFYWTASGF